jgi:uncharacterized membrane protein YfcA
MGLAVEIAAPLGAAAATLGAAAIAVFWPATGPLSIGGVDAVGAAAMTIGAIAAGPLGARLASSVPVAALRYGLAFALLVSAIALGRDALAG